MADLALEGPHYLESVEDEEEEERIPRFTLRELERTEPPLQRHEYDIDDHLLPTTVPEPIRIRGIGGTTVFGLSNRFDDEFPQSLIGKVAREEFHATIALVNTVLAKGIPWSLRCLLCGCLCCCCTFGLSLGPGICFNKRTVYRIEKLLETENYRLYHKLNLNWRLAQEQNEHNRLTNYVLLIEFLPVLQIFKPD